ncbi:NrsF family protein [Erythrobacter sp. MTPC3]|uniref:NrsF family protein n=1 Tax=Erythrobacter sp. MTPC3 TaxID=3056564 RepID=UPI0036F2D8A3
MEKHTNRSDLIAAMTEDLTPVKRVKAGEGLALIGLATLIAAIVAISAFQWWDGLLTGQASGYFMITHGLLLVLGTASAVALTGSAMPRVGPRTSAPAWGSAMLAILPAGAITGLILGSEPHAHTGLNDPFAAHCVSASLAAATLVGITAVLWLRRGAPVAIERAGWLTGLAAGSLGTLAYGITCPFDTYSHVGLWHVAPVAIAAVIGRLIVPPIIRW